MLTPDYQIGCKRICLSSEYLETFNQNNVLLVTDPIECFTKSGIKTKDGTVLEVDTIILATGFDPAASFHTFKAIGINREHGSLQDEWGDTPYAYRTLTYPGYPNMFFLFGPGAGLGHNSVIFMSECAVSYGSDAVRKMVENGIKSMDVKKPLCDGYWDWVQESMKTKVFSLPECTSWYRNSKGVNYTLWPSICVKYWWDTRKVNLTDYNCIY